MTNESLICFRCGKCLICGVFFFCMITCWWVLFANRVVTYVIELWTCYIVRLATGLSCLCSTLEKAPLFSVFFVSCWLFLSHVTNWLFDLVPENTNDNSYSILNRGWAALKMIFTFSSMQKSTSFHFCKVWDFLKSSRVIHSYNE